MRRFSQRSHLVTLSEINITPLLDLAFVLLIIFVITTPLLEHALNVELPKGGRADPPKKQDSRTVEIYPTGPMYKFQGRDLGLSELEKSLVRERNYNPNVVVFIRADRVTPWDKVFQVQNLCAENGIAVSLRATQPDRK